MDDEGKKIAIPATLRQKLLAFRIGKGQELSYLVQDQIYGKTIRLQPWQFFILEVLPVCDDFTKLASVFNDRFGHDLKNEDVEELFSLITDNNLFSPSADAHPMVAAYNKRRVTRPIRLTEKAPGAATRTDAPEGTVFNTSDFTADEFKSQKKDIRRLCEKVKNDGYDLEAVNAPDNTVDWLNGVLQQSDFIEKVTARKPGLSLTDEIKKLKGQTEKIRKKNFNDLKGDEQNAIRRINRLLIELLYWQDAPRDLTPDSTPPSGMMWHLFNPAPVIKLISPLFSVFRYAVYLLPALIVPALFIAFRHADILQEDFSHFLIGIKYARYTYLARTLLGMFTDNLLAVLVTSLVAYSFRATVNSFFLELHLGFYPRFHVHLGHTQQLSRRERIWLHAAPLLARIALLSVCILVWFETRGSDNFLTAMSMNIGIIVVASLFLAGSPFIKSSCYHLLAAVLDEPQLRTKAALSLVNKLRGNLYRELDNNTLVAYALVSALYMVATFVVLTYMFADYVKFHFGGAGVFLVLLIVILLIWRLTGKLRRLEEVYERTTQFERWRKVALPKIDDELVREENKSAPFSYLRWSLTLLVLVALFVPYGYQPGGDFIVLPNQKAELTSENAAVIDKVYFDGGESLKKGAVIAQLSTVDYEGQLKINLAKVQEQQAVVDDLKSRPKPEEIELARQELEVQQKKTIFSGEKLRRLEKLYKDKTISLEELEDQKRQHEVDLKQDEQQHANLALVKTGATHDQIAAAEGKLQSYKEESDYYTKKIEQSVIYMPFDGKLTGINLKQKTGHFLNKGEVFAVAENTNQVFAQIEVPEPDIGYISEKAKTRVRTHTYSHDEDFTGEVALIDSDVTEKRSGNVVRVLTLIENGDGRLKSGMTGYAKIDTEKLPVWKVSSKAIVRFFEVEVWSWIP